MSRWETIKDVIKTFLEAQVHAVFMVLVGAGLALLGHHDEALLVLGAGAGMLQKHEPTQ